MSNVHIEKDVFGVTADGVQVDRYSLRNADGLWVRLITFGATVTELHLPDRHGKLDDCVLGFDNLRQYETESPYFGCIVGRVAFRIVEGTFELDGKTYRLTLNLGPHHLNGGTKGLSWLVWEAEPLEEGPAPAVKLTCRSPDGDQGYPGNLEVAVVYTLTERNELKIDYTATADQPTPVNLTHHGYFNLAGAGSGKMLGHRFEIDADQYSPTDEALVPTGELASVTGTPFDFREPCSAEDRIRHSGGKPSSFDLAYVHNHRGSSPGRVATVEEPTSGRIMEVCTNVPVLVFYAGEYLDGSLRGKGGAVYPRHAGFCLETGHLPDSVNQPTFPSVILRPGQVYQHTCIYRFSTKQKRSCHEQR